MLNQRVTWLYLNNLRGQQALSPNLALLQLLTTDRNQSAELGRALLKTSETETEFERRLSLIEAILANKFPDLTKEMIMEILDLKKIDITQSRFYQEIRPEGLKEGRQQEASSLVVRLLKQRLGELSSSQEDWVKGLSVEQLEALGEALLDFTDIANLENFMTSLK